MRPQCPPKRGKPTSTASASLVPSPFRAKSYEKGIGIGTPFVLTYDLGGAYTFFSTIAGVDDAEQQPENWVFEVYLDDVKAGSWPVAKDRAAEIRLETTGAQELVLVGAGTRQDDGGFG